MIILARMEKTGTRPTGKTITRDRNCYPEMEDYYEPHAILWCQRERKDDLGNAGEFALKEGYTVYNEFPKGTRVKKGLEECKVMEAEVWWNRSLQPR